MGQIRFEHPDEDKRGDQGKLGITLENDSDRLVLSAVRKARPKSAAGAGEHRQSQTFDLTARNVVLLWATGFEWEHEALVHALECLARAVRDQEPEPAHGGHPGA